MPPLAKGVTAPFHCEACGASILPAEGGKCRHCGRLLCLHHFAVLSPEPICEACHPPVENAASVVKHERQSCPHCSTVLSPWKVKGEFPCPHCHAALESNSSSLVVFVIAVWTVVELGIKAAVWSWLGTESPAFLLSTLLSGAFGFSLYYMLFSSFCVVRPKRNGPSEP